MDPQKAHADPTKDFFVSMITRDISLRDCILDLLDNCIDGAMRLRKVSMSRPSRDLVYNGCKASISISVEQLEVTDNCGGILLSDAIDYAFHFGRRRGALKTETASIGLYGIGMKRAIFKIGRHAEVRSTASSNSFVVTVDVDEWLRDEDDWDFDLDAAEPLEEPGAVVRITRLHKEVSEEFSDQTFINALRMAIARDYSVFMRKGLEITVNGDAVKPYPFGLREGGEFVPANVSYIDPTGVRVVIKAGMAAQPPDDDSAEAPFPFDARYFGWYVVCNDRVVIAGDKTTDTVWGGEFNVWHPQYYGFLGIAMFYSDDPSLLPWTTTKRGVERGSPLYRRAIVKMKDFTRSWVDYTNARKASTPQAKRQERKAEFKPIGEISESERIILPRLVASSRVTMTAITYSKPRREVERVARALGDTRMTNRRVGERTFEYFLKREVDED